VKFEIRLKSDKNIFHIVLSTFKCLTAVQNILYLENKCTENPLLHFHGSTEHIVDGYLYVNDTKETNLCVSMAALVTRTLHNGTLHALPSVLRCVIPVVFVE